MRAISLWEPYASAMRLGVKQNETRSWPTSYRGDLLICASKRKMTFDDLETRDIFLPEIPNDSQPPYGCALCVVELMDCIRLDCFGPAGLPLPSREAALGDYSIGRWVWRTKNLRILKEPIPIIDRQGLWIPDPEIVNKITKQLSVLA